MATTSPTAIPSKPEARTMPAMRRTVVGLHLFNAVSAVGGGIGLVAGGLAVPTTLLRHTPFESFVVPGIFLAVIIGGSATIGATALLTHRRRALVTSGTAGAVMVGWILGESVLVEGFNWLQGLYLLTGAIAILASIHLARATAPVPDPGMVTPPRNDWKVLR